MSPLPNGPKLPDQKYAPLIVALLLIVAIVLSSPDWSVLTRSKSSSTVGEKQQTGQTATTSPSPSPSPTSAIPTSENAKLWMLGAGGILATQNHESPESLTCGIRSATLSELLRTWWGVENHRDAVEVLSWLKKSGHGEEATQLLALMRTQFGQKEVAPTSKEFLAFKRAFLKNVPAADRDRISMDIDLVWTHQKSIDEHQLKAWDLMRAINVARWSHCMGYISEEEAWGTISFSAKKLQTTYASWDEASSEYILGRSFWMGSTSHPDVVYAIKQLKTDKNSPWVVLPWDTKLE